MPKPYRSAICWVRRDLRLRDHAALALATRRADRVAVAFVFDRAILDALEDHDDRRVSFIHDSLREMDAKLRRIGSRLVVRHGVPQEAISALARELGADAVFAARDAEPYARVRDAEVETRLREDGRAFETVKDTVVFEGREMPDLPHREYESRWRRRLVPARDAAFHRSDRKSMWPADRLRETDWSLESLGFTHTACAFAPGEDAARARLADFVPRLARYRQDRHVPALEGTSGLSMHLRFGTISIRECVRAALAHPSPGADKWLSELIWRDFYHGVLFHGGEPEGASRPFPGRPAHGAAWREGRTGYPLVDAAMRCLRATGTMHNRLRMVVASFFASGLVLDPREGEAWFARHLLDFDLANNAGGWAWCAGTKADARAYPPVLNPIAQSTRFDPKGRFILDWVPEVRELIGPALHFPPSATPLELEAAGMILGEDYPWPIVDLVEARHRRTHWRTLPTGTSSST